LVKRAAAVCRAAAGDAQYAATVADPQMASRELEKLATEPSANVDAAWLVADGKPLGTFSQHPPEEAFDQARAALGSLKPGAHLFLTGAGHDHLVVGCPVEAVRPPAYEGPPTPPAGELWLLIDSEEISSTVRQGFQGAAGPLGAVIFIAVALQLALALFVIGRLNKGMHELRETQGRLVRSDKLAAVGTLAAGMAHEINNPLAYVSANLGFLARELAAPMAPRDEAGWAEIRDAVAEARQGADRVRVIVRDLKTLSRGDEQKVAPVDLNATLEAAINIAFNEIKHRAKLARELGQVPKVDGNDVRLGQVFLNLLVNAAQAMPEGDAGLGEIRVVTFTAPDGRAVVEVRDNGVGIPPEHLPKLFDPFFTTKRVGVGTGLGLWVVHGIVSAMGGDVAVESTVGKGTTFRLLFPPTAAVATAEAPAPAPVASRRGTVLVVDDEVNVGRSIERMLGAKHEVQVAHSGKEALARLAKGERYDVILCDLMMPEMNGRQLFDELAKQMPELSRTVVFTTGGAFGSGAAEMLQGLENPCLEKPFDEGELNALVARRVGA
jgi:signal transduction histidine kinase/CheY-like chemotaxis protein